MEIKIVRVDSLLIGVAPATFVELGNMFGMKRILVVGSQIRSLSLIDV